MLGVRAARCAVGYAPLFFLFGVVATTCAVLAGTVSLGTLAATPSRVAQGRVWLLFSSALVADRPVALCLASFFGFAVVALALCGGGCLWLTALLGHVGSTLVVYLLIAVVRVVEPGALHRLLDTPDYGVSAIQAAWLGAVAAVLWKRSARRRSMRIATAAGCGLIGLIAWRVRPDLTLLDLDHPIAFAIGIGVVALNLVARVEAALCRLETRGRRLDLRSRVPRGALLPRDE